MKTKKENYPIYSIVLLVFGWLYFFIISYLNEIDFQEQFIDGILILFARLGKYDTIWFKLIAVGFGMISLYFSFKSKPLIQKKLRIFLILLSVLLIIMSIVAFPNLIFHYWI
ncbi:MAG: hypothetical protein VYB38_14650 [Bacteroidota bacterium]|nr:hypothetical protein [Bacteroidota bacterium]